MVLYKCPPEQIDSFLFALDQQRKDSQRCDFELRSGKMVRLACHRLIVENRTKLLRPSNEGAYHDCASLVAVAALAEFLHFVYAFRVDITIATVHDLLRLSREFALDQLRDLCAQFLDDTLVTDQTWLSLATWSVEFQLPSVQRRVSIYLAQNFAAHRSENDFLTLDVNLMKLVLNSDCLPARDERDVLDVVRRWIGHDKEKRMPFACDLLRCVRLPMLRVIKQDYRQLIAEAAFSSMECHSLLNTALDYVTSPSLRWSLQSSMTRPRLCQGLQETLLAVIPGSQSIIHYLDGRNKQWCAISTRAIPVSQFNDMDARSVSVLLCDKTLYMIDSSQGTMYFCLDIARNYWHTCALRITRRLESACVLADDCIFVIGGKGSDSQLQCAVESIDVESQAVSKMADLPLAVLHPCVFFVNRKIIAVGGCVGKENVNHVQVYDCREDRWTLIKDAFSEKTQPMSAACLDGVVYLLSSGKLYTFDVGSLNVCLFKDFGFGSGFGSSICVYRNRIAVTCPKQSKTLLLHPDYLDTITEASTQLPCTLAEGQRVHLINCTLLYQSPIPQTRGAAKDDVVLLLQKQFEQEESFQVMASSGFTLLHYACLKGDVGVVIALSKTEIDMSARTTAACTCLKNEIPKGYSPLHVACLKGNVEMATVLLGLGAYILAADSNDSTALYLACERGHESVVRLLLKEGAQVDARNNSECTPLMIACLGGFADIAVLLLNSGACVNAAVSNGLTPLMFAAWIGNESVVQILLGRGAHVHATTVKETHNAKISPGCSSLHIAACVADCAKVAKVLLSAGAYLQLKNEKGKIALDLADRESDVFRLLAQHIRNKPPAHF